MWAATVRCTPDCSRSRCPWRSRCSRTSRAGWWPPVDRGRCDRVGRADRREHRHAGRPEREHRGVVADRRLSHLRRRNGSGRRPRHEHRPLGHAPGTGRCRGSDRLHLPPHRRGRRRRGHQCHHRCRLSRVRACQPHTPRGWYSPAAASWSYCSAPYQPDAGHSLPRSAPARAWPPAQTSPREEPDDHPTCTRYEQEPAFSLSLITVSASVRWLRCRPGIRAELDLLSALVERAAVNPLADHGDHC